MKNIFLSGLISGLFLVDASGSAMATTFGPTPYLSFADSPSSSYTFDYFYLEDFEDGLFDVPGVTSFNNFTNSEYTTVSGPTAFRDSVDGDDGIIDGSGLNGHSLSLAIGTGDLGITFSFDAGVLGALPTYAGIVWTDGNIGGYTEFTAFDADDNLIGTITSDNFHDNSFTGGTAEDRFFGIYHELGIAYFTIRDPGSSDAIDLDHLQYGGVSSIPVPAAVWLFGTGLLGLIGTARRKA